MTAQTPSDGRSPQVPGPTPNPQQQPYPAQQAYPQQPYPAQQPYPQQAYPQQAYPQQAHPQQPYPAQQSLPGLQPGNGLVRVHIQGNAFTSSMIVPSLLLDGRPVPSRYGENAYQLPAGRHRVELFAQWMLRYGQALLDVDVHPGAVVDVFYAAPMHQFTTGSIGFAPQKRKGAAVMAVVVAVVVLIFFLIGWSIFRLA